MITLSLRFLVLASVVAGGGRVLARGADAIADATDLGRLLVGGVLSEASTSLPELAVDVAAVRAGQSDLAAGDLLGSSLLNLLIVAGIDLCREPDAPLVIRGIGGALALVFYRA